MKTKETLTPISPHGHCYVCGTENPHGIGLTWYAKEDRNIFSEFVLTIKQQGPLGHIHGGYGCSREYPVERIYCDARLMTIGDPFVKLMV